MFGDLPALRQDPLGFLVRLAHRPEDVVPLRLPLLRAVLLLGAADIERVLVADAANFVKPIWLRVAAVRRLLGNGLVTADGSAWRGQRAACQPAFHPARLPSYGEAMSVRVERMLDGWEARQRRDIRRDMARLTLDIAAGTLLGLETDDGLTHEVAAAMDALMACFAVGPNLFGLLPLPASPREARAARRLDLAIGRMIRSATGESSASTPTLLSLLQASPTAHSRRALHEQVKTFLAAGHDSSAVTLAWAFIALARNPEADDRLAGELSTVLGDRSPTSEDLPRLPYTRLVIKETLRLYPPLWMTGRRAVRSCRIGGLQIPAGTTILTSQWAVQRRPQYFREPDVFRPERWEGPETTDLPRYAYFPFGGGPRACIGTAFAMTETTLLLAAVARRYRLTLDPVHEIPPLATMTLRPAGDVWMRLETRA